MKRCPKCQSTYTDDTLRFCLQDGTPLVSTSGTDPEATVISPHNEPPPTEVMRPSAPPPTTPSFNSDRVRPAQVVPLPPPVSYQTPPPAQAPRSSNRGLVIALSALVIILLVTLGGLGAWLYLRERAGTSTGNQNGATNSNGRTVANANTRTSPSPTPTPSPIDEAAVRQQVQAALTGWAASTRARDINTHMSYYADTLETYYQLSNISSARVRSDRQKAFDAYDTLDVELSNIKITPDPSGERATVILDKTWEFSGEEKYSNGSVQQKLTLVRSGSRWLITGERDLQVYYKNSSQ